MWEALHARIAARLAATPSLALLLKPFHMYNNALEKNPFAVKSVTSGIMYCAGEMLCQAGEQYNRNKELPAAERRSLRDWRVYDWKRAGLFLLYGTVIAGPLYHIWFNRLDQLPAAMYKLRQHRHKTEILKAFRTLQRYGIEVKLKLDNLPSAKPFQKFTEKLIKIAADQFVFSTLYTGVFFISIGMMSGAVDKWIADSRRHSMEDAAALIRGKYGVNQKKSPADERLASDIKKIKNILEQTDVEDDSIDRVLSLLQEEEEKTHIEWKQIWDKTYGHMKEVYWTTFAADCVVWPPLQFINFTFVPLRYQALYVNICNLGWNTFLSFMARGAH